ncbi:hypothetical protein [Oceanobacillus chungangensis]|uniref:Uncharacterized protein n=1 Tax=Oceanobacillus chungangensis TaxID=1229152 RepID=A0A3D8PIB5_9BACI|nr:hypothetical protein [Oceanobacillus chungangensis]RDW14958.1 hypothetical protein CWR45_19490 [Oceanobacillus chungangensis]
MFKSEIANRIISLIGFSIIVFALFNINTLGDPIAWSIVVVFTVFHLYGIINYLNENRNDSLN